MTTNVGTAPPDQPGGRAVGILLIATALAMVGLLANHPGGETHDFAELLKSEAANRMMDAIVHGGFIFVLAVQLVCYAAFSRRLGWDHLASLAGLALFGVGAAFLMVSMLVDGLMIPSIAAKYAGVPEKLEYARSLFVFAGAALQFVMPLGLGFQALAVASWGFRLVQGGEFIGGVVGVLLGIGAGAAMGAAFVLHIDHLLMVSIAALAVWALIGGILMAMRTV